MACEAWIPRILSRLYAESDTNETALVDAHLAACEGCRREHDSLLATRRLLASSREEIPPAPRVVVLGTPARVRPALAFAAGVFLAGLVAVVSFRMGASVAVAPPPTALATSAPAGETLETAARTAVDRKLDEWLASRETPVSTERPMTRAELDAALERFATRLEIDRRDDLDFLMARIAASDQRTEGWMDQTQRALQYVAYGSTPGISPR
jgi:hypothetical protein